MITSNNENKKSDLLINFLNKLISIFLIFISISLFLIMFSFNADDTERDPQHGDMILQSGK